MVIRNVGVGSLGGITVTIDGPDAASYLLNTSGTSSELGPLESTSFTVTFQPAGTFSGTRTATLHIASGNGDAPFGIDLIGAGLSQSADSDSDGLNDASEWQMTALGFDWQVSQADLVGTLFDNANGAGLYTPEQVQALNIDVPLIGEDPATGDFLLTIGIQKSPDLKNYIPFPMSAPQTSINAEGKLEFRFTNPDPAAFFRLESN